MSDFYGFLLNWVLLVGFKKLQSAKDNSNPKTATAQRFRSEVSSGVDPKAQRGLDAVVVLRAIF